MKSTVLALSFFVGSFAFPPNVMTPAETPHQQAPEHSSFFLAPMGELVVPAGDDYALLDLVQEFERLTGEIVMISRDTEQSLKMGRTRLKRELRVKARDIPAVVQSILITHRFVITNVRRDAPRMISIASLESANRASIKENAFYIPIEELATYEENSALLVTTTLTFEHLDLEVVGTSMRQMVVDPNVSQYIPVRGSNTIIITGFANRVSTAVKIMRRLDEGAKRTNERRRQLQGQLDPKDADD